MTRTDAIGFRSVTTEYHDHVPRVEGSIPSWLSGVLIRNGPGWFEAGGRRVNHWFDGLAMLRRYAFADGEVRYSNRFLRTEAFAEAQSGRLTGQFGTDTRGGWRRLLEAVRSLGLPEPTDNANVHVARLDDAFVALTEAPRRVAFDPVTLETRGAFAFDDDLPEHLTAAHLVADPHRGETIGFSTTFGRPPQYHLYRVADGSRRRERIASIPANGPAYVHDCSVTADHVVLVESPLVLSVWRALDPRSDGAIDLLDWRPERPTRVLVVDRETGDLLAEPTVEATFCFHHVNAFVDDEIVLDLVEFPDSEIVESLSLSALDGDGFPDVPTGRLVRYRIDPGTGRLRRERLFAGGVELPRVVADRTGRRHRYAYGQATDRSGGNGLVKVDCERARATEWSEPSVYVEEPIPVRRPGGTREDDGCVLATAVDVEAERGLLLVFDADTLALRARVLLPHVEPFGFHGRFFPSVSPASGAGRS